MLNTKPVSPVATPAPVSTTQGTVVGGAAQFTPNASTSRSGASDSTATVRSFIAWLGETLPEAVAEAPSTANQGLTHQQDLAALLLQDEQRNQAQRLAKNNAKQATDLNTISTLSDSAPTSDDSSVDEAERTTASKSKATTPTADSVKEASASLTPDATAWLAAISNRPAHQADALPGFTLQQALGTDALSLAESVDGGSSLAGQKLLSAQLERWLNGSLHTGAPVRIHLDKTMSLVLRLKQGQVHADFLQQQGQADSAAKLGQLQTQLDELKQRLANQRLPVGQLSAKGHRGGQGQHQPPQHHHPQQ